MAQAKTPTKKKRLPKGQRTHNRRVKQAERKELNVTVNPGGARPS
jgi:hypothetical protein